jgi:hypothetical protein
MLTRSVSRNASHFHDQTIPLPNRNASCEAIAFLTGEESKANVVIPSGLDESSDFPPQRPTRYKSPLSIDRTLLTRNDSRLGSVTPPQIPRRRPSLLGDNNSSNSKDDAGLGSQKIAILRGRATNDTLKRLSIAARAC